ncbi:MAG: helix-turn-helix transcriptional regulator [Betaproteobacteria bacterium]|nr:helix-turn-helix transcriptional regulator [Betaproteobacteria bacterium]MBK8741988.1 helix-turn-helix transcriptional regulator [Betaproteobacteria bacterium]MBK9608621.1 helix-turn-helix transcriptional regulator [Betaproteobacteria bacterium]
MPRHPRTQVARVTVSAKPARVDARPSNSEISVLSNALRRLRSGARLTLKELSARSGIAASTLSKIENGQLSPTYEKIVLLADGLGVDVAELFDRESSGTVATGRRAICRRGEGVVHKTRQYEYEMVCADVTRKEFLPIVTRLRAHSLGAFPELLRHEGEEFVYVLEGQVTLHSDYYEPFVLNPGDSCYFDSHMGHALVSSGAADARILWVCSKNTPVPQSAPGTGESKRAGR